MEHAMAWSEDMSLGISELDNAHKFFFDELARLFGLLDAGVTDGFADLIDYLERHFYEEEALLTGAMGFINPAHREDHTKVLRALRQVAPDILIGDRDLACETLRHLARWFVNHLFTMDLPLAVAYELNGHHEVPPSALWLRSEMSRRFYRSGIAA